MPLNAAKKLLGFALSEDGSIKSRIVRSAMWVGVGEGFVTVLAIARTVILARLLAPEMFGLMGLCGIVIGVIETFTRPGIGKALIQRQSSFEEARDTAFTLLLARGLLLAIVLVSVAPLAATFYESPDLQPLLFALSSVFIIDGLMNVNTIARRKELDFRRLTYLQQTSALLGTLVTIAAAYWMRNVWALVIGQIFIALCNAAMSYVFVAGKPKVAINWQIARELLSYGKFITASSAILFLATSLDTAVIGKVLGTQQLGYYVLAFTFANLVTANLSKVASGIMMPAYSKLQSDLPALRRALMRTLNLILLVTLPATVGVIVTAELVVHVVYGPKWQSAIVPLQILVIFGLFRAIASVSGYVFEGIGKPQIPLYAGLFRLVTLLPLIIPLSMQYGLVGAAIAVTLAMAVQSAALLLYARRHIGASLGEILLTVSSPFWKSIVMGAAVYGLGLSMDGRTVSNLLIMVFAGILTYGALNFRFLMELRRSGI